MSREKFRAGAKRPAKPIHFEEANEDLFGGDKGLKIKDRFDSEESKPTPISDTRKNFLIRNLNTETIELIKNLTWTENCNNEESSYSQIIEKAIEVFVQQYESKIIERPEFIKKQEMAKGRKS